MSNPKQYNATSCNTCGNESANDSCAQLIKSAGLFWTFDNGCGGRSNIDLTHLAGTVTNIHSVGDSIFFQGPNGTTVFQLDICDIVGQRCNASMTFNDDGSGVFTDNAGNETPIPAYPCATLEPDFSCGALVFKDGKGNCIKIDVGDLAISSLSPDSATDKAWFEAFIVACLNAQSSELVNVFTDLLTEVINSGNVDLKTAINNCLIDLLLAPDANGDALKTALTACLTEIINSEDSALVDALTNTVTTIINNADPAFKTALTDCLGDILASGDSDLLESFITILNEAIESGDTTITDSITDLLVTILDNGDTAFKAALTACLVDILNSGESTFTSAFTDLITTILGSDNAALKDALADCLIEIFNEGNADLTNSLTDLITQIFEDGDSDFKDALASCLIDILNSGNTEIEEYLTTFITEALDGGNDDIKSAIVDCLIQAIIDEDIDLKIALRDCITELLSIRDIWLDPGVKEQLTDCLITIIGDDDTVFSNPFVKNQLDACLADLITDATSDLNAALKTLIAECIEDPGTGPVCVTVTFSGTADASDFCYMGTPYTSLTALATALSPAGATVSGNDICWPEGTMGTPSSLPLEECPPNPPICVTVTFPSGVDATDFCFNDVEYTSLAALAGDLTPSGGSVSGNQICWPAGTTGTPSSINVEECTDEVTISNPVVTTFAGDTVCCPRPWVQTELILNGTNLGNVNTPAEAAAAIQTELGGSASVSYNTDDCTFTVTGYTGPDLTIVTNITAPNLFEIEVLVDNVPMTSWSQGPVCWQNSENYATLQDWFDAIKHPNNGGGPPTGFWNNPVAPGSNDARPVGQCNGSLVFYESQFAHVSTVNLTSGTC